MVRSHVNEISNRTMDSNINKSNEPTGDKSNNNFPTPSTVPFPYVPPYPVQLDLMSAILSALRQCRETDASSPSLHDSCSNAPTKRTAPIIMIDSPTGTGKSLSLACASMAWLRYCENDDLDVLNKKESSDTDLEGSIDFGSNNGTVPGKTKYHWMDEWQPPADHIDVNLGGSSSISQTQQYQKQQRIQFAIKNRAALDRELNGIRSRLNGLTNVSSAPKNTTVKELRERERSLRENVVRSGISSALSEVRSIHRLGLARGKDSITGTAGRKRKRQEFSTPKDPEDYFLVTEYHSDDEEKIKSSSDTGDEDTCALSHLVANRKQNATLNSNQYTGTLSAKAMLHGSNLDGSGYPNDPERNARIKRCPTSTVDIYTPTVGGVSPGTGIRKILYAARTHSQLSQFIGELRRTHWGASVKAVALGSRSLLCSNEAVLKTRTNTRRSEVEITEICLDMQKGKKTVKDTTSCPFLASSDALSTLALHSLARPSDIEDIANLGKTSHTCSYYASREALAAAEVVVVSYNTLLSRQARTSIGLSLKNVLVVIDEAHNVPEALRNISSCHLSLFVIEAAMAQLSAYTLRYSDRLSGRNLYHLGQIRRVLLAMKKYLKKQPSSNETGNDTGDSGKDDTSSRKEMMASVDLMFRLKLDNINLFTLIRYLEKSRLPQKLLGFVNHTRSIRETEIEETDEGTKTEEQSFPSMSKHVSALSIVETFLQKLTCTSREGRVVVEWPSDECHSPSYRFVQIHSASLLDDMIGEAHAIILAGGTLRPFTHVAAELFGDNVHVMKAAFDAEAELCRTFDVSPNPSSNDSFPPQSCCHTTPQLTTFTCGHVIPPGNVLTSCLSSGPTSLKLDFRHSSRSSNEMIDELGRSLLDLCDVIPSGFVVFLPSYGYESRIFQRWRSTGMIQQINKKKAIHREPSSARDVETALSRYSTEATSKTGAILFSVMGGKMSEGINFANDMARCVLVVGLPYPDITDPVLQEKMQSLDRDFRDSGHGITGKSYYQNLCMRTVNQSVGRAIRHANDYAAIVLADFRYETDRRVWMGLPVWLRSGKTHHECPTFGNVLKSVRLFFAER